jgi:olfactory receptor
MSPTVCVLLVIGPYAIAAINITTHTTLIFCLPFCGSNAINHFFCDISPLLSLACADTWINKLVLFVLAGAIGVVSGLIIMVSYVCILVAILKIQTADGRRKAFSTCSSHLAAVSILYATLFLIYVRPSSSSSLDINKVISVFYTVVIPMLNPLIYSLRNNEVKDAFRKMLDKKYFLLNR